MSLFSLLVPFCGELSFDWLFFCNEMSKLEVSSGDLSELEVSSDDLSDRFVSVMSRFEVLFAGKILFDSEPVFEPGLSEFSFVELSDLSEFFFGELSDLSKFSFVVLSVLSKFFFGELSGLSEFFFVELSGLSELFFVETELCSKVVSELFFSEM
jgi:hypothetical protein